MTTEDARAERETTGAWSDVVLAQPLRRFFELEDVERLDWDAVRLCDGYEYRYRRGGRVTWFSKSTVRSCRCATHGHCRSTCGCIFPAAPALLA